MNTAPAGFRTKVKTNDPQIIVTGRLKTGDKNDIIVFSIPLLFFELVCIVNIPFADAVEAPVYVKLKVHRKVQNEVDHLVKSFDSTFYTNPRRASAYNGDEDDDQQQETNS